MIHRENSYFYPELCVDGHYIVTGISNDITNDIFCAPNLQLEDVREELHRYLRQEQGFDAVFFLDGIRKLHCFDQASFDVLQGGGQTDPATPPPASAVPNISGTGPARRRLRARTATPPVPTPSTGRLHMGMMQTTAVWAHLRAVFQDTTLRCALVINTVDSMQEDIPSQAVQFLEEFPTYHAMDSNNPCAVIYLFRESAIRDLLEGDISDGGYWATLVRTVLLPRIRTSNATDNRVITLGTPNAREVEGVLNRLRLRPERPLSIQPGQVRPLSRILASACARQRMSLRRLMTNLDQFIRTDVCLSEENWMQLTGESGYRTPMETLDALVGMAHVKTELHNLAASMRQVAPPPLRSSSRFAPLPSPANLGGRNLNIVIKGETGTGKTTLARMIAQLYYEWGLLPQGQLVECTASDLVSANIGQTASLVREQVQRAMGGVLFIDEAYTLCTNDHGQEAINQLVNDLSSFQGQFAVVVAAYPHEMDEFMRQNPGLPGRFATEFNLPAYTPEEMREIFCNLVAQDPDGVTIAPNFQEKMADFFVSWVGGRTRTWGNAREAGKLFQGMKTHACARGRGLGEAGIVLSLADIPEVHQHCLAPRSANIEAALAEIDKMIGLGNIKTYLRNLSQDIQWGVASRAPGNYVFLGPPGAGKTTIARKMGEIFGLLGVLKRTVNNVVEVKAADLINGSVTLNQAVEDARGGVLFIDEAHQLGQDPRLGYPIITALVPIVDDPAIRGDTCFIVAGYSAEMNSFFDVDPGLVRRFPDRNRIRFNDYSAKELVEILEEMAKTGEQIPSPEYLERSLSVLERYLEHRPKNFGNGGYIRDVYLPESLSSRTKRLNRMVTNTETGMATMEQITQLSTTLRTTLTADDMPQSMRAFTGPYLPGVHQECTLSTVLDGLYGKAEVVEYLNMQAQENTVFMDTQVGVSLHGLISGNIGTGRHTVAKAFATAWKEYGYLDSDYVNIASKATLEAGFVGQTNVKVKEVIEHAMGGVLLVEYPSSMLPQSATDNTFGVEALGTLVGAMRQYSQELSILFLDTEEGMDAFLQAFPSVVSLGVPHFALPDLTPDELERIFVSSTEQNLRLDQDLQALQSDFFLNWVSDRGGLGNHISRWGNGKEVETLVRELIQNWSDQEGAVHREKLGENNVISRRIITRAMMPQRLAPYLRTTRASADTAMEELYRLPGLGQVKDTIQAIRRRLRRLPADQLMPGVYLYTGNPGTGKTTVANLMGGVFRSVGALSQGHLITRTARELCQQAESFEKTVTLAKNGILFIDEAHQLADSKQGHEILKKLLTILEDVSITKNTCIILAGYPRDMQVLLAVDSGLASRFETAESIVRFEDYTPRELVEILERMAQRAHKIPQIGSVTPLQLTPEYRELALRVFQRVVARNNPDYGNARFVRNFLHDSVSQLLLRLEMRFGDDDPPSDLFERLTDEDIPAHYRALIAKEIQPVEFDSTDLHTQAPPVFDTQALSQSVVYLESYVNGQRMGTATGTIITTQGHVLTCAHVVDGADSFQVRVYTPGANGGDYRWCQGEILSPVLEAADMAIIQLEGNHFVPAPLYPREGSWQLKELGGEVALLGYPLGNLLSGHDSDALCISEFYGSIASVQAVRGIQYYYIDATGLHGNSGSPVFSLADGRMLGVFSASVRPEKDSLDELNFFYPISYFWDRYVNQNGGTIDGE